MCGIVGIAHTERDRPVACAAIRTMCHAIRHRGPDDEGLFVEGPVGLGVRRLSIIDLAGGAQPIANEDESLVIVFNGEIYNYRDLRTELIARGHRFRSAGDTETILHLYEEHGPECVERLRGMFAFAIYDRNKRALFLARDRFGIKPLYYVEAPWGIAFASELKALVAAGLTGRDLDWSALDVYLQLGYIPAPATPFRDVRKLEPAHWLAWRSGLGGTATPHRYWDLPRHTEEAGPDIERRVLDWLDDSVAAHLVSDVPVAAFLSGGLDSSAVVAGMALVSGGGVSPHAFTARYTGSDAARADETALARALADRYGARLTVVDVEPNLSDLVERVTYALDEPHADDSALPTWALSVAVGTQYKVALTGIGGDELFAGYRRHVGLMAAERYARLPQAIRSAAAAAARVLREPSGSGLTVNRLKRFLGTGRGEAPDLYLGLLTRIADPERRRLYAPDLRPLMDQTAARNRFRHLHAAAGSPAGLPAALYFDYKTFLPDDVLALSDRLSMAHGLEVRVPLVDHLLVENVFPLPASVKLGPLRLKHLLRRALAPRLPAAHFRAPKRGFVGPTAAWLRHELRPMLEDELSAARLERIGYFEPRAVQGLLGDHLGRRDNREGILWALFCFSVWHRQYVERGAPVPHAAAASA